MALGQPTLQLPAPHAATKHHQAVCPRTRPCRSNLPHHPPGHSKCASYHSSSRALTPPPRRSWPHLRHRHSSPSILGFVGRHHAHTAPPGTPTSNSSSPATPSRSPRNPNHPGSHPSPRTTPTPRLRIPLLGRPCSGLYATNTARPRTTTPERGWQRPAALASHQGFRTELMASLDPPSQAMLQSQSGPYASRAFTTIPFGPDTSYPSHLFRVLLLRRLRLPLPLSARVCRCRRILDPLGDHRAACAQAGVLRGRGVPLERAAARVCREAGARVTSNTRLSDLNLEHIDRHDDRRIEVIANGLPLWGGGGATGRRHHFGISMYLL